MLSVLTDRATHVVDKQRGPVGIADGPALPGSEGRISGPQAPNRLLAVWGDSLPAALLPTGR